MKLTMYSLISYSHATMLLVLLFFGEIKIQLVTSYIFCHCDTDECRAFGYKECKAEFYCYSIYELNSLTDNHVHVVNRSTEITGISISRGCISNSFLTMCTNKDIQQNKQINSPYLITRCCRDAWCNTDKVKIAQTDWSLYEVRRYPESDYSNYGAEPMKPVNSRQQTQFKGVEKASTSGNSRNIENIIDDSHLPNDVYSESILNSELIHQDNDRSKLINSRRGIRRKPGKGNEHSEKDSSPIASDNFQLTYFNPIKSTHSKSYSMNILLAKPIYVAMGISLTILLFGLIFLSSGLLIYRKNKHFHISNCRKVCNYSCNNRDSIVSPINEKINQKYTTGILDTTNGLQNWNQVTNVFSNQHSKDQPLLLNGISPAESMNPSTGYRSLTLNQTDSNWLKPRDDAMSTKKNENKRKENMLTYHCWCCYSNDSNADNNDTHRNDYASSENFKSYVNLSQFNKRTITNDNTKNNQITTNNTTNDHLHPVICEESEFSLNTDNQKQEPSSVSTPLFSIHSSSIHQLPDFVEYRKFTTTTTNNNNNKSLLINDQDTFTWIKNQQSHNQHPIQLKKHNFYHQQLQHNLNLKQDNTQQQVHSLLNDFSGNCSDSSYIYDIDNKNNSLDYELIKVKPKSKFNETELDWSIGERKNNGIQLNTDTDSRSPGLYNNTGINTDGSSSGHQENGPIQQPALPVQFTDLLFSHLPPPPSYPPPPLHHQQQQLTEIANHHNINDNNRNNKNSPFVDLHRFDVLLQRQRGTGKTSSGGDDSKTIESEQSDVNQTYKLSNFNENSSELNAALLRHKKYSPDLNKLTERKYIESDLIGLATFRKGNEKAVDLVTPYAQFDLSPDSSMCIIAE
ncbi:GatA-binding transcription factor [Schistosoma japonicum]|nr:GatA-binding transcription factor [Schistosoma japonicum]